MSFFDGEYPRYVSVAERRRRAERTLTKLHREGQRLQPVVVEGRGLVRTVWGRKWCDNLEAYSDFANRLPRGRSYVSHGLVVHLEVQPGRVQARVCGTELYTVEVQVKTLPPARWKALVKACAGQVSSVVELLQGRLPEPVMEVLCRPGQGLFPTPSEVSFSCTCPDIAVMCKHVAAALYGVGVRLDTAPELLFTLRQVDGADLVTHAAKGLAEEAPTAEPRLEAGSDLAGLFGIELAAPARAPGPKRGRKQAGRRVASGKTSAKRTAVGKGPAKRGQKPPPARDVSAVLEALALLMEAVERQGRPTRQPRRKTRRRP